MAFRFGRRLQFLAQLLYMPRSNTRNHHVELFCISRNSLRPAAGANTLVRPHCLLQQSHTPCARWHETCEESMWLPYQHGVPTSPSDLSTFSRYILMMAFSQLDAASVTCNAFSYTSCRLSTKQSITEQHSCCIMSTLSRLLCGLACRKTTFAELLV